jgi:c-di-GMP-binding flagellar brake protein YcgR
VAVGNRGTAQYFSRLAEETADTLRIGLPEMQGETLNLSEGDPLRLWYTQSGGYWCLETKVVTLFTRDGERLVEVDRHGEVHRAQRRNHVRVDVGLMLHATVERRAEGSDEGDPLQPRLSGQRISAVTRNISGGGVSFRTASKLETGDRLSITFYLPEHGGDISSRAKVVHVGADPERPEQYVVACMFERMAISDRERIIRFLFFRQRELAARRTVGAK